MKVERAADIERMLAEIHDEVHYTRDYIKLASFSPLPRLISVTP